MKFMSMNKEENKSNYFTEIQLLQRLDNEHIIKHFDHFEHDFLNSCIITEYCEVSSRRYLFGI